MKLVHCSYFLLYTPFLVVWDFCISQLHVHFSKGGLKLALERCKMAGLRLQMQLGLYQKREVEIWSSFYIIMERCALTHINQSAFKTNEELLKLRVNCQA